MLSVKSINEARLTLAQVTNNRSLVYIFGQYVGLFIRDVDGFYYFDPSKEPGLWGDWTLRLIANKLTELNVPWSEELEKYFATQEEELKDLL